MPRSKSAPNVTREDLIEAWESWQRYAPMVVKRSTISEYSKPIRLYLSWLESNNMKLIPDVHSSELAISAIVKQVRDFVLDCQSKYGWGEKYCTIIGAALKTFYNLSLGVNIRGVKIPVKLDAKSRLPPFLFTEEEVERILKTAEKKLPLIERTMVHLGYYACLRAVELVTVRPSNFIEENGKVYLEVEVKKLRRERKTKKIAIPEYIYDWVLKIIDKEDVSENRYLFRVEPERRFKGIRKRRYLPGEWSKKFRDFVENIVGIKKSSIKGSRYWHNFARTTRLTLFVKHYKPTLPEVLLLSGHQEPKTCLKYFKYAGVVTPEVEELIKRYK